MKPLKLSLRSAIFINLNIILGTGIFINTVVLAQHVGPWGALTYLTVGALLLPLILALAHLVKLYKGGSFYDYAATIHPFVGFLSQWCYFVGKLAACTLGIYTFVLLMQNIIIPLKEYSTLLLAAGIVFLFIALNMLNLRINRSIQMTFFVLKMIPILCVLFLALIYFAPANLINTALDLHALGITIPFALYAFTGFEATCSLVHTLENPERDGPRAILYSYGLSVLIAVLFQTALYMLVGPQLETAGTFLHTFPLIFKNFFQNVLVQQYGVVCMHVAIACSSLGAAYGVFFSNAWNLWNIAEKKLIPGATWITKLTRQQVPAVCIAVEGAIVLLYLWYTHGAQIALQQTNTLALTTTFTLSVLGLLVYEYSKKSVNVRTVAACASCMILLIFLARNFMHYHTVPNAAFVALVAVGVIGFLTQFKYHKRA